MNNYAHMKFHQESLEKRIQELSREIEKLPAGDLQIYRAGENNKYSKWYVSQKIIDSSGELRRQRSYLSKDNSVKAELIAKRGLLEAELKDLQKELRAVNMYLRNCSDFSSMEKYISRNHGYDELLKSHIKSIGNYTADEIEWMNDRLPGLAKNQEERVYLTKAGIPVRSKNEVIIISNLVDRSIPFKYEERLDVPGLKYPLWPDLKLLQPRTHTLFVWEHFGMMERLSYSNNTSSKLDQYRRAGFVPGRNMIITFEDERSYIDEQQIVNIIDYYFG